MRDETWIDDGPVGGRPGLLFGVCRWLADRLGLGAGWVRLAAIVATWLTGWWPGVALYLAAAIILGRARPVRLPNPADWRLPRGFTSLEPADLRSRYSRLERRVRDVEAEIGRRRRWDDVIGRRV
jgi:phage shock protein C